VRFLRRTVVAASKFNPSRIHLDRWAAEAAALGRNTDFRVLDAGAGRARYRKHFAGVNYETADFLQFGDDYGYGATTYVCDLRGIPVEGGTFDLVFCTQTLEHVPDPSAVLAEFKRVVKPGGQVWISVPLFYEEHDAPYDFYRYTQFGLRHLAESAGFTVRSIEPLEGYYATLSYQLQMASKHLPRVWLPVRALFLLLAVVFARLDVGSPKRDVGMCKNYRCILVSPAHGS
jgi:SAM-dependent methyltransferase